MIRMMPNIYHDAFKDSPLPMWIYDLETLAFLDVNQAAIELYGYSKKEFLEMTLRDIRPLEEVPVLEQIMRTKIREKAFNQSLVVHCKKNGERMFVSVKGNATEFEGRAARFVSVIDLTEHQTTAEALAQSERRFQLLVQDGSDLVTIFDQQGVYKFASPTAMNVLGVEPEALIGRNVFDFVHPEDRETAKLQFELIADQHRIIMPPFRYRHFNGETRWMETIITNRLNDPVINGIITNSRDVTERLNQEIERKKILQRYNTVSKATSDAIWDLDLRTKTITWNKGLKGLFGYNLEQSDMDWWKSKVKSEDLATILGIFDEHIKQGISKSKLEYRFQCADGTYKTVMDRSFIHFDEAGQAVRIIGSMQDVSEQRKYIAEIEIQNEKMREIARMQSHDLRAPLASFMGLVSLIDPDANDPDAILKILPLLKKSAEEVDAVIRAITKKAENKG